jgi:hypothetical protein
VTNACECRSGAVFLTELRTVGQLAQLVDLSALEEALA